MDLGQLLLALRRNWKVLLPVAAVTLLVLGWALFIRPASYEGTSVLVLIGAPSPPVDENGRAVVTPFGRTDNPYSRVGNSGVVVGVVARSLSSDPNSAAMVAAKEADGSYAIDPGIGEPTAVITAVAPSAEAAGLLADKVADAFSKQLEQLQKNQGVDPNYFIATLPSQQQEAPRAKLNSSIRLALGIVVVGVLVAFVAVSISEAITRRRANAGPAGVDWASPPTAGGGAPSPPPPPPIAGKGRANGNATATGSGAPSGLPQRESERTS
ncbi:MAG: hypothetical protein ACOYOP_06300 [Microthrixaceae bacterium]